MTAARARCSSVFPAPARPRCRPIPNRILIGDDEHGWGPNGIFNFEGGCYAKCIKLSQEAEPMIWDATNRFGSVLENVVFDPTTRVPDYDDGSKTENTRSAYPLDFIPNASRTGTCRSSEEHHLPDGRRLRRDAAGRQADADAGDVSLPLRLHREGGGHRKGSDRRGAGILDLLRRAVPAAASVGLCRPAASEYINKHNVDVWLVNSGWTGGIYGVGRRMPIKATRTLVTAALDGSLKDADFRTDPYFGFSVPTSVPGVEPHLLEPDQDLEGQGRVRQDRARAGRHVPEELRQVRGACHAPK